MQQVNQYLVRWLANTIHKETTMPQGHVMPQISIDNQAYDLDTLSIEAKAQLQSMQFVDAELARLQAQAARMAYSKALQAALPVLPANDIMKFN